MQPHLIAIFILVAAAVQTATSSGSGALRVVPDVDYQRYAGTWYEIARLPNRFQRVCASDVTATYTVRPDGRIDVTNRCRESNGDIREATGIARRVDGQPPSILQVRFAPAFLSFLPMVWGDYHIIDLAADYHYAVVGAPSRSYLWILARRPRLDDDVYRRLADGAREQGFNSDALIQTAHTNPPQAFNTWNEPTR